MVAQNIWSIKMSRWLPCLAQLILNTDRHGVINPKQEGERQTPAKG